VELDAGVELDATECSKVADAQLVYGSNLGSGRGRRMERGRDERRESGRWASDVGRSCVDERRRRSPSEQGGAGERSRPANGGAQYRVGVRRRRDTRMSG